MANNNSFLAAFCIYLLALSDSTRSVAAIKGDTSVSSSSSYASQLYNDGRAVKSSRLLQLNLTESPTASAPDPKQAKSKMTSSPASGMMGTPSKGAATMSPISSSTGMMSSSSSMSMMGTPSKGTGSKTYSPSYLSKSKSKSTKSSGTYSPSSLSKSSSSKSSSSKNSSSKSTKSSKNSKSKTPGSKSTKKSNASKSPKTSKSGKKSGSLTKAPTAVETFAPSFSASPTIAPNTAAPTTGVPTASPTSNIFPVVVLQTYDLRYTIDQPRFLLPSEYLEVSDLTAVYVSDEFTDAFVTNELVNVRNVTTVLIDTDFSFGDPVVIVYETAVTFSQNSLVPAESELNQILEDSFTGPNEEVYRLFLVSNLDDTNLFSTTTLVQFGFVQPSQERSDGIFSGGIFRTGSTFFIAAVGAGAGLVAFMFVFLGMTAYDRRQEPQEDFSLNGDGGYEKDHQTVGAETEAITEETDGSSMNWDSQTHASSKCSEIIKSRHSEVMRPYLLGPEDVVREDDSFDDEHSVSFDDEHSVSGL